MDTGGFGDLGENLIVFILIAIFIVLNIFLRKRKGERTQLEVTSRLLSEIEYNQKLMETFLHQWQTKKFRTDSWKRNNARLDFLDQPLQIALSDAFSLAEDFNRQVDAAKKYKSVSYLANISVDRLRIPLAKSNHGLEEWLQANIGEKKLLPKRRGLFG